MFNSLLFGTNELFFGFLKQMYFNAVDGDRTLNLLIILLLNSPTPTTKPTLYPWNPQGTNINFPVYDIFYD